MASEIHVNDYGTIFRATFKDQDNAVVNISGATNKYFLFEKPDCTDVTKTASLYSDGTDGIIEYTVESGLFNIPGIWQVQGYVTYPNGSWYSDIVEFRVRDNLA